MTRTSGAANSDRTSQRLGDSPRLRIIKTRQLSHQKKPIFLQPPALGLSLSHLFVLSHNKQHSLFSSNLKINVPLRTLTSHPLSFSLLLFSLTNLKPFFHFSNLPSILIIFFLPISASICTQCLDPNKP